MPLAHQFLNCPWLPLELAKAASEHGWVSVRLHNQESPRLKRLLAWVRKTDHLISVAAAPPKVAKKRSAEPCLRGGSGPIRSGHLPPPSFLTGSHVVWQGWMFLSLWESPSQVDSCQGLGLRQHCHCPSFPPAAPLLPPLQCAFCSLSGLD